MSPHDQAWDAIVRGFDKGLSEPTPPEYNVIFWIIVVAIFLPPITKIIKELLNAFKKDER